MIKTREFITGWNRRKHPFIWTKPAKEILAEGLESSKVSSFGVALCTVEIGDGVGA